MIYNNFKQFNFDNFNATITINLISLKSNILIMSILIRISQATILITMIIMSLPIFLQKYHNLSACLTIISISYIHYILVVSKTSCNILKTNNKS